MAAWTAAMVRAERTTSASYEALHAWSVAPTSTFWSDLAEWAGVRFSSPAEHIREGASPESMRWFPGARLNYADALLGGAAPSANAVIEIRPEGARTITFGELAAEVRTLAGVLRELGVGPGEPVFGLFTNNLSSIVSYLAVASLGAVYSSCPPSFGLGSIVDRIGQLAPKVMLLAANEESGTSTEDVLALKRDIMTRVPSLRHAIHPRDSNTAGHDAWPMSTPLESAPQLPFDHPLCILFSSGSTGLPKCFVHRAGGVLLTHIKEHRLHCDIRPGDRLFYYTNSGWMMWNWLVSALASGACIVVYDGPAVMPKRDQLWRLAEAHGVTHLGLSAPYIDQCRHWKLAPKKSLALTPLRCILSTGAPLLTPSFEWVYDSVKSDVHLASISGGTDIVGCFALGNPMMPVHGGELQVAGLGVDLAVLDEDGAALDGRVGELVCRSALPSMPLAFWDDPSGQRFHDAYFARYPGAWHHGDFAERAESGGWVILGRSDATLKIQGVRIGTSEIYKPLAHVHAVKEAMALGLRRGATTELALFVVLREGVTYDASVEGEIRAAILEYATKAHVPSFIAPVLALPKTKNGKLAEVVAARALNGLTVSTDALSDPTALDELGRCWSRFTENARPTP